MTYTVSGKLRYAPLEEGRTLKIEMEKETDLANLMSATEYRKFTHAASGAGDKFSNVKGVDNVEQ